MTNSKAHRFMKEKGCSECHDTGYRGRKCITEFLDLTDEIKEMILADRHFRRFRYRAVTDGMITLRQSAVKKVLAGETTLREINRVTFSESANPWDWITSRPQYCLGKIGVHDLAWAEVHRNWRGRPRYQCIVSALPEGIVRLSPLEQNVFRRTNWSRTFALLPARPPRRLPVDRPPWRPACGNGDFAGFGCAIGRRAFTGPSLEF